MNDQFPSAWGTTGAVAAARAAVREAGADSGSLAWVVAASRSALTLVREDGTVVVASESRGGRDGRDSRDARGTGASAPVPVVGDVVRLAPPFLPSARSSRLARSRTDGPEQVLAANVDVVLLVVPVRDAGRAALLERLAVLGWASGASPVLVVTKADTATAEERGGIETVAARSIPGVPVRFTSATTGEGVDAVADLLRAGGTGVVIGHSGAGKSSLINAVVGEGSRAVGATRARDQKGRHTTTAREVIALPAGGFIIDSPGVRELGVVLGADLDRVFGDVEALAEVCRYADCRHAGDAGCAVRAAVEDGSLPADRVRRYLRIAREAEVASAGSGGSPRDKSREYARHARAYRRARGH